MQISFEICATGRFPGVDLQNLKICASGTLKQIHIVQLIPAPTHHCKTGSNDWLLDLSDILQAIPGCQLVLRAPRKPHGIHWLLGLAGKSTCKFLLPAHTLGSWEPAALTGCWSLLSNACHGSCWQQRASGSQAIVAHDLIKFPRRSAH